VNEYDLPERLEGEIQYRPAHEQGGAREGLVRYAAWRGKQVIYFEINPDMVRDAIFSLNDYVARHFESPRRPAPGSLFCETVARDDGASVDVEVGTDGLVHVFTDEHGDHAFPVALARKVGAAIDRAVAWVDGNCEPGQTEAEPPPAQPQSLDLQHLAVLRLEPHDVLVFRAQDHLQPGAAQRIKAQLNGFLLDRGFPNVSVLVLEGGADLAVLRDGRIGEREQAVASLRDICRQFGDNDWPDDLHLADVLDKHLGRHLEGEATDAREIG
jgi:hypothetical protein